jgi:Arc/MetJ-type ribon-helix-helix transcriptional regulator
VASDITYSTASEWVRDAITEKINSDGQYRDKLDLLKADIDIGWQQADEGQLSDFDFAKL